MTQLLTGPRQPNGPIDCRFELDTPKPDDTVRGDVLHVSGWALLRGTAPSFVAVHTESAGTTRARVRLPRPDVAAELPEYTDAGLSGFDARIPIDIAPGESRGLAFTFHLRSHEIGEWTSPTHHVVVANPTAAPGESERAAVLARQTARHLSRIRGPAPDPKHVLVLTHSLAIGGGQLWLHQLLDGLVKQLGWRVSLVTQLDGSLRAECEKLGIPVHLTSPYRVGEIASYEGHVAELAHLARASGAGVALVNTLGAFPAADAVQRAGMPCAWVVHESFRLSDFAFQNWGPAGLPVTVRKFMEESIANSDRMLFVADATREMFLPLSVPHRCETIRYGTPMISHNGQTTARQRASARRQLGIPQRKTLVVNVGVLEPRKGQGQLVAAMERVREEHPDALLHIVGNHPSPYARALTEFTERSTRSDYVTMVPLQDDPTPWFHAADLFVNCSDVESLPRSILESICCGVPVLASDVFGAREIVRDGYNGWLFEPNDVDALATGVLRALDTPVADRQRMASAAFADLHSWLDPVHYATHYSEVLNELARNRQ